LSDARIGMWAVGGSFRPRRKPINDADLAVLNEFRRRSPPAAGLTA